MKEEKIEHVLAEMSGVLGVNEQLRLREVLHVVFEEVRMVPAESEERQRMRNCCKPLLQQRK